MTNFNVRERILVVAGTAAFFAGVGAALTLSLRGELPLWAGSTLAVVAIAGMVALVGTTVRALTRGDTEGVEQQHAARASMVTVLVVVVAGFGYSLLEAFAGLPRVTGAAFGVAAGLVWMIVFAWQRPGGEEG